MAGHLLMLITVEALVCFSPWLQNYVLNYFIFLTLFSVVGAGDSFQLVVYLFIFMAIQECFGYL